MRGHGAVDRKRGAGERRRPQRALVAAPAGIGEAAAVARRHLHIGEEMVPEGDRLGGLEMGEARHHRVGMGERLFGERALVGGKAGIELVDGIAHPQAEVGRDLVVARARRVQAPGRPAPISSASRASTFMWMSSSARLKAKPAAFDFRQDGVQAVNDPSRILRRNDALLREHFGVGAACRNVLAKQLAVDIDRGVYVRHDGVGFGAETAAPHLVAHDRMFAVCIIAVEA